MSCTSGGSCRLSFGRAKGWLAVAALSQVDDWSQERVAYRVLANADASMAARFASFALVGALSHIKQLSWGYDGTQGNAGHLLCATLLFMACTNLVSKSLFG
jgi:hypothetical protein